MKTIDTRGQSCPIPLIMAKKALKDAAQDDVLEILIDNATSLKNVSRFLEDNGYKINTIEKEKIHHLYVTATGNLKEKINISSYCEPEQILKVKNVIVFKNNKLGHGDAELGEILIKGFINTLPEISVKPSTMIFLNSGIFLTLKNSGVVATLKSLEKLGVEILVCGTCLDYYKKKDELGAGKISNMYDILECMTQASKIIFP